MPPEQEHLNRQLEVLQRYVADLHERRERAKAEAAQPAPTLGPEPQRPSNSDSRTTTAYPGIASCGSVNPFAPKPVGRSCGGRIGVISLYANRRWSRPCDRRSLIAWPRDHDAPDPAG